MSRCRLAFTLALAAVLFVPALGADDSDDVEMKIRVFVSPDQIEPIARQVLEFYEVTPGFFTGAVSAKTHQRLVEQGYKVEVLVADVRAEALKSFAEFHTYQQIMDTWAIIATNNPSICRLDTIGTSAGGNLLVAMRVTDNPNSWEPAEPRNCYDGMAHGNENNGTEIVHLALVELVSRYGSDPDITRWVNNREIWLLPWLNPDGLIARRRTNNNGVDLNRNYGYSWDGGGPSVFSETEIQAVVHLGRKYPMTTWTQFHSGTESAMWPWGYTTLATRDSLVHAYEMQRYGQICNYPAFQIARDLYPVNGGSTDWYYGLTGALGYAPEVCHGQPSPPAQIDTISRKNWTAMKEMIERSMWGISGQVTNAVTDAPIVARLEVEPPGWLTYSDSAGYFHKNLHAGTYTVTAFANGYAPQTVSGVTVPADTFAWVDIELVPDTTAPITALWGLTNQIEETPSNTNTTNHSWALGERDGRFFSIGKDGWASFDMGEATPIINGPGTDLFVVEGDDGEPEACSVYASNDWNGPWQYLGFGTGTQAYDLSAAGLSVAQFIRIADDDVGGGSGQHAGFDIDAVEAVVVNAPAVLYVGKTVIDSPPGGNADGKLDPGEYADLIVELRNVGRVGLSGVTARLRTADQFVSVLDSSGSYGNLEPDSTRRNDADRFVVVADAGTPREYVADMVLHFTGTDFQDSVRFTLTVGELRAIDPIPDGPRSPALFWAYDDVDTGYAQHPSYDWVEIRGLGTRLTLSDDQTVQVSLPSGFGPWIYYGQLYGQVSVCSNGWVAPGSTTNSAYSNTPLPSGSTPPNIALLWDDLYPATGNGVWHYHDSANHRFIVEYDSVHYYSPRTAWDKAEFILYDTTVHSPSGDNVFVIQYYSANNLASATLGIEDPTCAIGIECSYNGSLNRGCSPLVAGRAIKYTSADPTGIDELPVARHIDRLSLGVGVNPFRGATQLSYDLSRPGRVELEVYDGAGRRVRTLVSGFQPAGRQLANWDGCDDGGRRLSDGVYWLRLAADDGVTAAKAVLLR